MWGDDPACVWVAQEADAERGWRVHYLPPNHDFGRDIVRTYIEADSLEEAKTVALMLWRMA